MKWRKRLSFLRAQVPTICSPSKSFPNSILEDCVALVPAVVTDRSAWQ
jgi:hypothetical protein